MADVKKVLVHYLLDVSHDEFQLIFRAVGQVCGAKVSVNDKELEALREVNLKLAKIRASTLIQMADQASAAVDRAGALLPPVDA